MNKDVKKLWVDALRSGEYSQCKNALHTSDNQYCCLGVLCALAVQAGIISPPTLEKPLFDDMEHTNYCYDEHTTELPEAVMKWAGLTSSDGDEVAIGMRVVNDNDNGGETEVDYLDDLASHNDTGKTFDEIAAAVDAQL